MTCVCLSVGVVCNGHTSTGSLTLAIYSTSTRIYITYILHLYIYQISNIKYIKIVFLFFYICTVYIK